MTKTKVKNLAAWFKKYYPVPAYRCKKKDALKHSLRKWHGLRPSIVKEYNCWLDGSVLYDQYGSLNIDDTSCALCQWYSDNTDQTMCEECPIVKITDLTCDGYGALNPRDLDLAPYILFVEQHDVEPMIEVLEKALKLEQKKAKKKK